MDNMLTCDLVVSKFEFQLHSCIHLWTNTLGKGMNPLILRRKNNTTIKKKKKKANFFMKTYFFMIIHGDHMHSCILDSIKSYKRGVFEGKYIA